MKRLFILTIFLISNNVYSISTCKKQPGNITEMQTEQEAIVACNSIIKESKNKVGITDICMVKAKEEFNVHNRKNKCYIWVHKIIDNGKDAITVCHPVASGKKVSVLVQAKKLDFLHMLHNMAIKLKSMKGIWSKIYDFRGKKKSYLLRCNDQFYVGKTLLLE